VVQYWCAYYNLHMLGSVYSSVSIPEFAHRIANALIFVVGAVSVIMVIWGGLKYAVSMGHPKRVASARDTIVNALVGVVIALCSYAIVNFVIGSLK